MLSVDEFVELVDSCLHRSLNTEQRRCVQATSESPLLIIAGPGTGKTTVMVLRALRHLLVDKFEPEGIAITTFTKKAAEEVRTRWLDWGLPMIEAAKSHPSLQGPAEQEWLNRIDLNHCTTGTLDSICEDILGELRPAGTVPPVLIEGFPANQLLLRAGLQQDYFANKDLLNAYLAKYSFGSEPPRTVADVIKVARPIVDRFVHDQVDLGMYRSSDPDADAKKLLATAHGSYQELLSSRSQMDFALLEQEFLARLRQGLIDEVVTTWRALLVDEYQDTNPLQESIYFEIIRRSHASLSVVGDDDQSLYRFRGATVELFTQFVSRLSSSTGLSAVTGYLTRNYRSTPEIVRFFNRFLDSDPAFADARIHPPKPDIDPERASEGIPVLGMFRQDADVLAHDLAKFLQNVFRNGGAHIDLGDGKSVSLSGAEPGGDMGDAVFLSHSVQEYGRPYMGNPPAEKLPLKLRRQLEALGIGVFNPRGQALADQANVRTLLGLVLECLDRSSAEHPDGVLAAATLVANTTRDKFREWRQAAAVFIAENPSPGGLLEFVEAWKTRTSQTGEAWPDDWPLLELCFKLITWIPDFNADPEHQVWLEAISRAIAQARLFSPYGGTIRNRPPHDDRSRGSIIRDVLRPIADGLLDLDEELVPSVPRDRLCLMTIHQAKGLEFPLVIVDVSSGFSRNHPKNAAFRYPTCPSNVTRLEDDLADYTDVGPARITRPAIDRTFDDLVRLYYVAYSRPQTALLLVGLEKSIVTASTVRTVATGWRRDGTWSWHTNRRPNPTFASDLPLVLL